ncbi:conjugal transfer protein TraD [Psychrilyobacter sp.]|uniref:conjugal transfer protein TraD n=1 Tax=Psychrilyobacter sp. TaxID=2586924 RepID=UPI0030185CED
MKKLMELKDLISQNEKLVKKHKQKDRIIKANKNKNERKQRAHELIKLGVLFEIAGLKKENKALLLGYLLRLENIVPEEKKIIKEEGQKELDKRELKNKNGK